MPSEGNLAHTCLGEYLWNKLWIFSFCDTLKTWLFFEGRGHNESCNWEIAFFFGGGWTYLEWEMMNEFECFSLPIAPPAPAAHPHGFWPHVLVHIGLLVCSGFKAFLRTRGGTFTLPFPTVWEVAVQAHKSHFHFQKQSWWNTLETFPASSTPPPRPTPSSCSRNANPKPILFYVKKWKTFQCILVLYDWLRASKSPPFTKLN